MSLDPLSRTALIPLWARAQDACSDTPILADEAAIALADRAASRFGRSEVGVSTQIGCCIRNQAVDNWTFSLASNRPDARPVTIVDLGVGLDTRALRFPELAPNYIEVDSEPIIRLRNEWVPDTGATRIAGDGMRVADWLPAISDRTSMIILLLEGVLTYQFPATVHRFFDDLALELPGAYVVFDSLSPLSARMANRPAALEQGRPRYFWTTWRTSRIRSGAGRLRIHEERGLMDFPRDLTRAFSYTDQVTYRLPLLRRSYRLTVAQVPGSSTGGGKGACRTDSGG